MLVLIMTIVIPTPSGMSLTPGQRTPSLMIGDDLLVVGLGESSDLGRWQYAKSPHPVCVSSCIWEVKIEKVINNFAILMSGT